MEGGGGLVTSFWRFVWFPGRVWVGVGWRGRRPGCRRPSKKEEGRSERVIPYEWGGGEKNSYLP